MQESHDQRVLIRSYRQGMATAGCFSEHEFIYMIWLDYWKRYDELSDNGQFEEFKKQLINEINDLHIDGLPRVDKLNALVGKYVNLEYTLPNGQKVKFLNDQKTYLGNQLESEFGGDRCFGILAGMDFILVCTYEKDGENPELLIYKKR